MNNVPIPHAKKSKQNKKLVIYFIQFGLASLIKHLLIEKMQYCVFLQIKNTIVNQQKH